MGNGRKAALILYGPLDRFHALPAGLFRPGCLGRRGSAQEDGGVGQDCSRSTGKVGGSGLLPGEVERERILLALPRTGLLLHTEPFFRGFEDPAEHLGV